MRVILTEHLTNDTGTFLVRFVACVSNAHHTVEYSAMDRFETVAHIREGTSHNHRHRIVDVGRLHLLLDVDFNDSVLI